MILNTHLHTEIYPHKRKYTHTIFKNTTIYIYIYIYIIIFKPLYSKLSTVLCIFQPIFHTFL